MNENVAQKGRHSFLFGGFAVAPTNTLKILIGEMVTFTSRQRGFVLEELI